MCPSFPFRCAQASLPNVPKLPIQITFLVQGKRRSELLNKVLACYPPVLHRWFLARFPEPATWHRARLAFTRTTAVWSMVGHIVGLGDRHGENILLDATTGDCVHVDFAFLFDRVKCLAVLTRLAVSSSFCCRGRVASRVLAYSVICASEQVV